ncbi:MAG: NAD(P)-dependent oxidoreductase [Ruminiclostridium sp.]|nr:NAD(P)-dependent oxidoreductase [Ruminiclostridium sp.]
MKKAIVTGANGFVGGALVRELLANNIEVVAIDLATCSNNIPEDKLLTFVPCSIDSIADIEAMECAKGCDVFYHFAWVGSAGEARANCSLQLDNAKWTIDCLRTAHNLGCTKFVCAGSIMEQETMAAVYTDGNKPGAGYIYGSGKLVAHTMSASVATQLGIDLVWANITNSYGPGEISPRLVNTTLRKIIAGEAPTFTSGVQNYDFVYITDVARAFYLLGEHGHTHCTYVIGSGNAKPLKEFLLEMKGAVSPDLDFIFGDVPFTGINMPVEKFSIDLIREHTGFCPEISFAEGSRKTMEWIKEQN